MNQAALISDKLKGISTVANDQLLDDTNELKVCDYALEEWARYVLDNSDGYPSTSSIEMLLQVRSTVINGVPRSVRKGFRHEVVTCNIAFETMKNGDSRSIDHLILVQAYALARSDNQSIERLISSNEFRDGLRRVATAYGSTTFSIDRKKLFEARRNFADRYSATEKILENIP